MGIWVSRISLTYTETTGRFKFTSPSFDGSIPLAYVAVEVNGYVISPPLPAKYKVARTLLIVSGTMKQLKMKHGANTIVVIVNGARSEPMTLDM